MNDKNIQRLTEKEIRRLHWAVWIFLIVSLIGMANTALYMLYRHYNPMSPAEFVNKYTKDPYKPIKHVRVNGVDYAIPIGYFRRLVPKYTQAIDIYLIAMRPDLKMLSSSEDNVFKEKKASETVVILAHDPTRIGNPMRDPARGPDFEAGLEKSKEIAHRTVFGGEKFGLEFYNLVGREIDHGELYAERHNGMVISTIHCDDDYYTLPNGNIYKTNPQCRHTFYDGYITYEVRYPKIYLKDWKETERKVVILFKTFRDNAKQKGLEKIQIPEALIDPMYYDTHPKSQLLK